MSLAQTDVHCCTGPHINWRPGRTDQPGAAHACLGTVLRLEELDNICLSLLYLSHSMPSACFLSCDKVHAARLPIATWHYLPLESWVLTASCCDAG